MAARDPIGLRSGGWRDRLTALIRRYRVPGAALAFLHEGEIHEYAAGMLNLDTGVEATTDSLFQIGSVTKVWTATQLMLLRGQGRIALDTRVAEVLPEFKVADADVSRTVTIRHLLSHTSGLDGDLLLDTGRGDDCIERYVAACAELPQVAPPGTTHTYCNAGFIILGRVLERVTGKVWDDALREQIIEPLGLTHTWTLPEDVLRFRAATGHLSVPGADPRTTPVWGMMRSFGPTSLISASAADVVAFGREHLDGGAFHFPVMREPEIAVPNPYTYGGHWGLGWILTSWGGHQVLMHPGNTLGQSAMLWVVPEVNAVVALLSNADHGPSTGLQQAVATELFAELYGLRVPPLLGPPREPPQVDVDRFAGVYERTGTQMALSVRDGALHLRMTDFTPYARLSEPVEMDLVPVDATTFVGRRPHEPTWSSFVFFALPDGSPCVHHSVRATPKIS
ncbi:MAG: beta-lactamase [Actinomycetia bacterium]|nr:beta-lactamase [Actinomycetes bacterium]